MSETVPYLHRDWRYTSLQFEDSVTQSRMLTWWPGKLLVGYTRTMMAALLWQPQPRVIGMIGLGGGSQAKFIHHKLPGTLLEVVENNAAVIALRRRFGLPEDGPRLQVIHGDGAEFVRAGKGRYDILLVDAYDRSGIPATLSTQDYYHDCRAALRECGVMASNLFCDDADTHIRRIEHSFGKQRVLAATEPGMQNRIVFAWTDDPLLPGTWPLSTRAGQIAPPARRALKPVLARVHRVLMTQLAAQ